MWPYLFFLRNIDLHNKIYLKGTQNILVDEQWMSEKVLFLCSIQNLILSDNNWLKLLLRIWGDGVDSWDTFRLLTRSLKLIKFPNMVIIRTLTRSLSASRGTRNTYKIIWIIKLLSNFRVSRHLGTHLIYILTLYICRY